jgi:hypothetical protein
VEVNDKLAHYCRHSREYFSSFVSSVRITAESLRTLIEGELNGSNVEMQSYVRITFSCSLTNSVFVKEAIVFSTKSESSKRKIIFDILLNLFLCSN